MAITISGENNNDRILAADGVIDQISGINFSGIITASHINVGSNIQLGNAGIVTATTFIGNLTGNVNSTSPLLLQTGGSERFRITGNNELGIAGANYGTSGQVLTSGGSGSAVSWTTIPTQVTIANNAVDRVITGGSGTNLNGEAYLTFSPTSNNGLDVTRTNANTAAMFRGNGGAGTIGLYDTTNAKLLFLSNSNGDFNVQTSDGSYAKKLTVKQNGLVGINTSSPARKLHIFSGNTGHPLVLERGDNSNTQIEVRSGGAIRGLWGASSTANFMVYDNDASDIQFAVYQTGEVGISPGGVTPSAGDLQSGDSQNNPLIHVKGTGVSGTGGEYNLLGRFEAGGDADNTGAMIVLNHTNDRGLALIGGRGASNRSYGAIKSIDNLGRLTNVMAFQGDNGQGVEYLAFYTGNSTSTTSRLHITSTGQVQLNGATGKSTSGTSATDLLLANGAAIRFRRANDSNWINTIGIDSSDNLKLGWGGSVDEIHFGIAGIGEQMKLDSTGRLLLGSGATATPKITGPGGLDVSQYGLSICMGGSSGSNGQARANATTKEARLVIPHYTNAEEPLTAIAGFSASSFNYLNYGGGTSLGNVATRHQFYTAANTTTTGGSEKLKIEHSGVRSFATFVDTSYHANPDPFGDGSGIVYYRLNDNFHDSGMFAKHGTSSQGGDPTFAFQNSSGERCWNNPTDGAISIPNLKNSYPFTMAAWVNISSWPTSSNNDLIMNLSIGGQRVSLCIVKWADRTTSDPSIMYGGTSHWIFPASSRPTNEWIHLVYSVVASNNSGHAVYQNGSALSAIDKGSNHGGNAGWAIGGNASNGERFAMGRIGSIRFFNKAITSSEASALYTNDKFYT